MLGFVIGCVIAWMASIALVWWMAATDGYDRGRLDLAAELAEKKLRETRTHPAYRARHDTATRPRLEVVTGGKAATATAAAPPAPATLPSRYVTAADLAEVTVPPSDERPHLSSGRCWCDDFHRDQPTTLPLISPRSGLTATGELAAVTDEWIHNMRYTEEQYRKELAKS